MSTLAFLRVTLTAGPFVPWSRQPCRLPLAKHQTILAGGQCSHTSKMGGRDVRQLFNCLQILNFQIRSE